MKLKIGDKIQCNDINVDINKNKFGHILKKFVYSKSKTWHKCI